MNGVLIDDKRIKVDFSQSVSKYWINFKKNSKFDNNPEINTNDLTLINEKKIIIIYINMFFIKKIKIMIKFINKQKKKKRKKSKTKKKEEMKEKDQEIKNIIHIKNIIIILIIININIKKKL